MALRAPERHTTLEEDLARALALSRADKRLGDYFPTVGDPSSAWHFNGSEHAGGGFDQDQYAYHDRKGARREWEVSVVQFARERDLQDRGWEAEQEWRDVGSVHAMEEAEVERAKRRQEDAWLQEQHGRKEPALKAKPRQRSAAEILASRSTTLNADDLAAARTSAWANGLRFVGDGLVAEDEDDPTEPAQLRRIPSKRKGFSYTSSEASVDYREHLYNPHSPNGSLYTPLSRSASYSSILNIPPPRHHADGVRRNVSIDSSSRPPTLPSKHSAQRLRHRPPKERTESFVVVSTEEHDDGPRPSSWSTMDTRPEDIRVFSPSHPSEGTIAHIRSRPGSSRRASRRAVVEDNYVYIDDEKSNRSFTPEDDKKYIPSPLDDHDISVFQVPSTQISFKKTNSSAMRSIERLGKDDTIELPRGVASKLQSRLSKSPIAAPLSASATIVGRGVSPPARHITGTTLNNPEADSPEGTNPSHLQESLPLTINEVWGISRDWESRESLEAQSVDVDEEQASEATPTPTPATLPPVDVDKSLPGTPYTTTHSTISIYKNPSVESFALLRRPLSGGPGPSTGVPGSEPSIHSPSGSSTDRPQHSEPGESVTPNSQQSEQSYPVDMVSPTETPVARYPRSSASVPSSNSSDTIRGSPQNGHRRGYSEGSVRPVQPIVQARNEKTLPPVPMQINRFAGQMGDPLVYTGPRPIMSHADRESAVRLAAEAAKQRSLSPITDEEENVNQPGATIRQSSHTFGNPDGRYSQVAFEDARDGRTWRHIRTDPKATIPSSLAPSTKSVRTRTSTLRASMRSPLPGISEKDTSSEYSWGGDEGRRYGTTSGLHTATWAAESEEDEFFRGDVREIDVYPLEGVVDPWAGSGVMTSGSSRHTRSRSEGSGYRQPYQDGHTLRSSPRSNSSDGHRYQGSFGGHGPSSQQPSHLSSMNNLGASAEWLCPPQNMPEVVWPEFNEEENMAGVGAHFRRALSTSKGSS